MRTREGRLLEAEWHGASIRNAEGEVEYFFGVGIDITQRLRVERALRERDRRHGVLCATARIMQFVLSADGTILEMDPMAGRVTGYDPDACLGRRFADAFLPPDKAREQFDRHWARLRETGEIRQLECDLRIRGDYRRRVVLSAIRDCSADADGAGAESETVLLSAQDVTELQVARERQRTLEERLASMIRRAPVVLQTLSRTGRILYSSENAEEVFGIPRAEMEDLRHVMDTWIHPEDVARIRPLVARGLGQAEPFTVEYRIRNGRSGAYEWMRVYGVPGTDPRDGRPVLHGVHVRITEEKAAQEHAKSLQEQLFQSDKLRAIGELAGGIAHDFNNLLAGILGSAEILMIRTRPEPREKKYLEQIIDTANQAASLIREINTFARKETFQRGAVEIGGVVRRVEHILRHTIDRRIRIRTELADGDAVVSGDAAHLQNMLINLGVNARDAMPDGGEIVLAARRLRMAAADWEAQGEDLPPGPYVALEVRDTGCGIPRDVADRMFEPFFTTKPQGEGTGLGLASVYGCVKMHGGHIHVESAPGAGSAFTVLLPEATASATTGSAAPPAAAPGAGGRVLLVDDEDLIRANGVQILRHLGYTPEAFPDGRSAIDFFREHWKDIDLVVLDMVMPKMSGREVFRALRRIDPGVRVLISTGHAEEQALQELLGEGALGVLRKPFRIEAFADCIANTLPAPVEARR
jgi:PAS domain S-box-containing protein